MAKSTKHTVAFKRRIEGKTDYRKRLSLLKSGKTRLVIRKTVQNIIAQLVAYEPDGDKILANVQSIQLKKLGLKVVNGNIPTAYLTGLLLAKKAKEAKVTEAIVDLGVQYLTSKARIYALIKGARDGGLNIHASDEVLPTEDRVSGKHIEGYATLLKENKEAYQRQFGLYLKSGIDPEKISAEFAKIKEQLQ
ncbi:MAG: large subunit ribosomal protein L18 [Candidatus Woesearchaeota archaeon]|jgi:large subunit ribosomal protein L18